MAVIGDRRFRVQRCEKAHWGGRLAAARPPAVQRVGRARRSAVPSGAPAWRIVAAT
jgi:hypothetical protein